MENKMLKSFMQGINLLGIIFIDILVLFLVTYFFDVDNFFTNGGLKNLKSSAITIRFGVTISIWILLLIYKYIQAQKHGLFHVRFELKKNLWYLIPLAIALPIVINLIFNPNFNFTIDNSFNFFFKKSYENISNALLNTWLQYLYWVVEMLIVIFIIDSFHHFGKYTKIFKIIPWGGIGLAFTWGLEQLLIRPNTFLHIFVISITAGILYQLSKRNFLVVFIYFIIIILMKRI